MVGPRTAGSGLPPRRGPAPGATAGFDIDAVALRKVEQRCVLPVPGQRATRAPELHFDLCHHRRCGVGNPRQLDGSRAECLEVDVAHRDAPGRQRGHQRLHHRGRAADIELMPSLWQRAPQQIHGHVPWVLIVMPEHIGLRRAAVDDVQVQCRVRRRQVLELPLEGMVPAVAQPVVKVHHPLRLLAEAPAQHAHHRCDADATADQHGGHGRVGIDEEVTARCLQAQDVADLHLVVEMVR